MHWMQRKKPRLFSKFGFWKNQENSSKMTLFVKFGQNRSFFGVFLDLFQKWYLAKRWGFLRWLQCIKRLLWSYQNPISDNFSVFLFKGGTLMIKGGSKCTLTTKNGRNQKTKTVFDSSKEAYWCTECNAKKPQLFTKNGFWKNQQNLQKLSLWCFWSKMGIFGGS